MVLGKSMIILGHCLPKPLPSVRIGGAKCASFGEDGLLNAARCHVSGILFLLAHGVAVAALITA